MRKLRQCQELVTDQYGGPKYLFSGTFANIEAASFLVGDPGKMLLRLSEGDLPPTEIRHILHSTLEEIDGKPIDESERDQKVAEIIEKFGLQDCALLSRHLISHAVIGTIKKKQIERKEAIKGMARKFNPSIFMPLRFHGLLWASLLIPLAIVACTTIR